MTTTRTETQLNHLSTVWEIDPQGPIKSLIQREKDTDKHLTKTARVKNIMTRTVPKMLFQWRKMNSQITLTPAMSLINIQLVQFLWSQRAAIRAANPLDQERVAKVLHTHQEDPKVQNLQSQAVQANQVEAQDQAEVQDPAEAQDLAEAQDPANQVGLTNLTVQDKAAAVALAQNLQSNLITTVVIGLMDSAKRTKSSLKWHQRELETTTLKLNPSPLNHTLNLPNKDTFQLRDLA